MGTPHRIYTAQVMHRRLFPVTYQFRYRVFSLLLDLDALDRLPKNLPIRRFGLISFSPADHGPRDGTPLKPWIDKILTAHNINLQGGRIRLLCFPRILGFGFNPLSLWYCEHRDGHLMAVLAEVNNTFGEHHNYLLINPEKSRSSALRQSKQKCFHVSPLMTLTGEYQFRLSQPDHQLKVLIKYFTDDHRLKLLASQTGIGEPLTQQALSRIWRKMPLMTFKVIAAIHWQALKIWLRGVPLVAKSSTPPHDVS